MSVHENKSEWLIDVAVNNVSHLDVKFEMTGCIFTLYALYLTGSMIIGIPGNSIVLAIYYKYKPSSNLDCYILSIAVLDLVCLVGTVPMYIIIQTKILDVIDVNTFCKALNFTGQIVTFAESFLLCTMAMERFVKVCRPKSTFSLDRRGKHIVLSIILSTIFISVPNLVFLWITNHRHCVPITNPPWFASAFFLLTVSLFIAMFGIVSFSYASVAKTLFQSVRKTTQNSIASRMIIRRNKIVPLPYQTGLKPTTSCSFERKINETSFSVSTNIPNMHINGSNRCSRQLVTVEACFGKPQSHRNNCSFEIKKDNEDDREDVAIVGETEVGTVRPSGIFVEKLIQAEHIDNKLTHREKLIPESFENMSVPQKRRLFRTTKVSFLITIAFIISWLPVWIYTVLVYANAFRDPNGAFFLKQSYLVNTFMDPIIYVVCNRNFRNKAKGLFFKTQATVSS